MQGEAAMELLADLVSGNGSNITGSDVAGLVEGLNNMNLSSTNVSVFMTKSCYGNEKVPIIPYCTIHTFVILLCVF